MKNEQRRSGILKKLKTCKEAVSATVLAEMFSVTRQVIVADIALLRASGHPIRAEHKGYVLEKAEKNGITKRIVVKHSNGEVEKELYIIVDNGATVVDVIVEHSVYGKISAELNLSSRYDVDKFLNKLADADASPLSNLTEGLHIHTLLLKDTESFDRIVNQLKDLKILVDYE